MSDSDADVEGDIVTDDVIVGDSVIELDGLVVLVRVALRVTVVDAEVVGVGETDLDPVTETVELIDDEGVTEVVTVLLAVLESLAVADGEADGETGGVTGG